MGLIDDNGHCTCAERSDDPHTCPYKMDVGNGDDALCTCCEDCQYECAMGI